jgi:hypothetical protein
MDLVPKATPNGPTPRIKGPDLMEIIPKSAPETFKPTQNLPHGYKWTFEVNGQKYEIKIHSDDANAAKNYGPTCNSGVGWTAQIKKGGKWLLDARTRQWVKPANNDTHIPVDF